MNWNTLEVIPGTEGIVPGPGMQLTSYGGEWNGPLSNLRFADFAGGLNLTGSSFVRSWLDAARFTGANLTNANFNFTSVRNTTFTDANITGATFWEGTSFNFTKGQFESTASFKNKSLHGIELQYNNLSTWNFSGQDLTGAKFNFSTLTNANFGDATIKGVRLWDVTSTGFTFTQLSSTASYLAKNLEGIELPYNDLTGWNFQGQNLTNALLGSASLDDADFSGANLTNASLFGSTLANANFAGAIVKDANFENTLSRGFTRSQFESTTSFQAKDLQGVELSSNDLTGWDFGAQNLSRASLKGTSLANASFSSANLTNANLSSSTLTNANFSGATITGANLRGATGLSFTRAQFESTTNFPAKDLRGVGLSSNDLTDWNFQGQNLTNANLGLSTLAGANFTGATVLGASFEGTTSRGFTFAQLQSTASYQAKNLQGISLLKNDLTGWDLRGQNLTNAFLGSATLTQTNLTGADLRGAHGLDLTGAIDRNTILPNGHMDGLGLAPGERLIVRDEDGVETPLAWLTPRAPISVTIEDHMTMALGSTLQFVFETDPWNSTIAFEPGIAVRLGGTLDLTFADDVNIPSQNGRTFRVFNWAGVSPTGTFSVSSTYSWDVSKLYTTGEVTLAQPGTLSNGGRYDITDLNNVRNNFGGTGLGDMDGDFDVDIQDLNLVRNNFGASIATNAVPEPHAMGLLIVGAIGCAIYRRQRSKT